MQACSGVSGAEQAEVRTERLWYEGYEEGNP